MSLPIFEKITSVFHKTSKEEYYIVFLIESKFIKVAVWEKINGQINILKISREEYSGSVEDLIETSDKAISKASFGVPQEQLNKVIFSVPYSWSHDGKIESNYLKILKNLCSSLSLKPLGFVITGEAMVKALEASESLKINFLLLHIGSEILNLSHIEHGVLLETVSSLRSENGVGEDLLELVSRFKATSLPNKIVIFDGEENLDDIKQEIIKTPLTQKEKRFLHFPTVESLGGNADITAVIHTVGKELGAKSEKKVEVESKEEKKVKLEEKKEKKEEIPKVQEKVPIKNETNLESLGFFEDRDVPEEEPVAVEKEDTDFEKPKVENNEVVKDFSPKKAILIIAGVFTAVIFLVFLFWIFFVKADVTLNIKTKKFASDINISLSSLSGKQISISEQGEMTADATGKKKTGDKATGEVVIFNKNTDSEKTFNKGTIIANGDIKFVLDEDVTVASASMKNESGSETKIFGKSTVKVTAEKFGNEYNVEDNKDWSVADYSQSSFSAHNDRAFSGGTTKEVQVVSEDDQSKLLSKLEKSLEVKAKNEIVQKINSENEDILGTFTSKQVSEKKFSADPDEEAKKVTLSLKVKFSTYSYQKSSAKKALDKLLVGKIPDGLFLNQNSIVLKVKNVKQKENGDYDLTFDYEANAIPKIDPKDIANKIKLKPVGSLDNWLKTDEIINYSVKISPSLPLLSGLTPPRSGNIKISLKY